MDFLNPCDLSGCRDDRVTQRTGEVNVNNARKEQLLYQKAHGQGMDASPAEKMELRKYKVDAGDGNLATKANIRAYIKAVDSGYRLSFYDYCYNNRKGDRRRKGHSEKEMASSNLEHTIGVMLMGWLIWGVALYWAFGQRQSVGSCAVMGAIISAVLQRINRRWAGFTCFILPCIIAAAAAKLQL